MRQVFTTVYNERPYDIGLLILRIGVGCFMMRHGLQKLEMLMGDGPIQFADPMGMGQTFTLYFAIFAELICSFLIMIGLATRLATIPLIITMLVAVLIIHAADPIDNKELGSLYLVIYVVLTLTGAGKYSVDHLISGRRREVRYTNTTL